MSDISDKLNTSVILQTKNNLRGWSEQVQTLSFLTRNPKVRACSYLARDLVLYKQQSSRP